MPKIKFSLLVAAIYFANFLCNKGFAFEPSDALPQAIMLRTQPQIASPILSNLDNVILFRQDPTSTTLSDVYINSTAPSTTACKRGGLQIYQYFSNKYTKNGQDIPIGWDVGNFTGFYPTNNLKYQIGLTNVIYGGSAIQVENGELGWQMQTITAAPVNAPDNFGLGICATATFCDESGNYINATPFANPDTILNFSLDLQVPNDNVSQGNYNSAGPYFYFIDPTVPPAGLGFWYSFTALGATGVDEKVIYDGGTSSAIIGALPENPGGSFSTPMGGAPMQVKGWKGFKTFNAAVTATNLQNAIAAIKATAAQQGGVFAPYAALSDDPSVYIIGGPIIDTEIANVNGSKGSMGLSFRNIKISLIHGGAFCTPQTTTLTWSCGAGQPNDSFTYVGGGCYQYESGQPGSCED